MSLNVLCSMSFLYKIVRSVVIVFTHPMLPPSLPPSRFDTVGDLTAMKGGLPKVIRATRSFSAPSPDGSVSQDELLVLKQTKKSGQSARRRRRRL